MLVGPAHFPTFFPVSNYDLPALTYEWIHRLMTKVSLLDWSGKADPLVKNPSPSPKVFTVTVGGPPLDPTECATVGKSATTRGPCGAFDELVEALARGSPIPARVTSIYPGILPLRDEGLIS